MIPWQLPAQNIKLSRNAFLPNSQIRLVFRGEILTSPSPEQGRGLEVHVQAVSFPQLLL